MLKTQWEKQGFIDEPVADSIDARKKMLLFLLTTILLAIFRILPTL